MYYPNFTFENSQLHSHFDLKPLFQAIQKIRFFKEGDLFRKIAVNLQEYIIFKV